MGLTSRNGSADRGREQARLDGRERVHSATAQATAHAWLNASQLPDECMREETRKDKNYTSVLRSFENRGYMRGWVGGVGGASLRLRVYVHKLMMMPISLVKIH